MKPRARLASLRASASLFLRAPVPAAVWLAGACGPALAQDAASPRDRAASANAAVLDAVVVRAAGEDAPTAETGAYTVRRSRSATGLNQSLRDTPQSTSVVTRSLLDDFRLTSVNAALDSATGVVVEKVETDRTYYTARGFDIVNFQVDGLGLPFSYGLVDGDLDTAIYDRIDVIRGATGLVSGTGNPSATINFVRKRPTRELAASAGLALGSWNDKRVDADVSGPLAAEGRVRGRLVVAAQDKDSYLDRYELRKDVVYGVVEADLTRSTTLTVGQTWQRNRPRGGMWGALPLAYSDGTPTDYAVSTNTSPAWTRWNNDTRIGFVELMHAFDNGWNAQLVATRKTLNERGKMFYVYGTPDRATGAGLFVYPSRYDLDTTQRHYDLRVDGPFTLGGREHELVLTASTARSKLHDVSNYGRGIGDPMPDLRTWDGIYPEPAFDARVDGSDFDDRQRTFSAATRLSLADRFKLILGAAATRIESEGRSYGRSRARDESSTTPYAGAVFDLTREISAYASYTKIYRPQTELGADLERLPAADGRNSEVGLKSEWFERRLNASVAYFKSRQSNLAESAGTTLVNGVPVSIYRGVATNSRGFEFDLAGELRRGWKINAGYTQLRIKDDAGKDVRTFSPRRVLRASTTWQALDRLKLGASVNWRSDTSVEVPGLTVARQPSYALLGLMARWDATDHVYATLNVDNLTDRKYLSSLYWTQSYYGEPRSATVAVNWSY